MWVVVYIPTNCSQLFPPEPEPHGTRLDPQLFMSDWETQEDDNVEGSLLCPFVPFPV